MELRKIEGLYRASWRRRPCSPAAIAAGEEAVLPRDCLWPDGALAGVGADLNPAVGEEALERGAPTEGIADRLGINLFVIKSLQQHVPLARVMRGVLPFIAADLVKIALLVAFPNIALWLSSTMR